MKEIPMLFSTPMVQAIQEGRETQTRRIVKLPDLIKHPDRFRYVGNSNEMEVPREAIKYDDRIWYQWELTNSNHASWVERCRWKKGDLLWVRESFATTYSTAPKMKLTNWYKADNPVIPERVSFKWKPSIHMPKGAARIWLQVENIRVERLQDISEDDAKAEGVDLIDYYDIPKDGIQYQAHSYREAFESLWKSINGADSWQANPWIWRISFKGLSTTGKPDLQTT